jgi:hypothetical protein
MSRWAEVALVLVLWACAVTGFSLGMAALLP